MNTGSTDFAEVFARLQATGGWKKTAVLGGMRTRNIRVAGGGEGRWDSHTHTSETVVVWSGDFTIEFRDHTSSLGTVQCCVVPVGAEHRGTSRAGAKVILFMQAA